MTFPSSVRSHRRKNESQSKRPHARTVAGLAGTLVLGLLVLAAGAFLAQERGAGDLAKQQLEYTKANYVKQEHRIPMRDGTKLFTVVYVPKDASRQYPIMM